MTKMLSVDLCSDILAIRCINQFVCVGVGNCVNIYHIESREIVAKLEVFKSDNIHDIVRGPGNELFVFGGKNFSLCELFIDTDRVELRLRSVKRFDDWIIALAWIRRESCTLLSILFAHNNLCFYEVNTGKFRSVWCQEKCILYGGSLSATNAETTVFSGTVFQEILIWQAKNDLEYSSDIAVLHRLKGHKGVIFSVIYDSALGIISSTSDDRTVRLWRVEQQQQQQQKIGDQEKVKWDDCQVNLTTTMYGHTARVWRSIIRANKVITIGEDSLMCVWSLNGQLLDKVEIHNGSEVWSLDVSENNEKIFTGGADGAVNVWPFESPNFSEERLVHSSDQNGNPKFVFYTNSRSLLMFMDGGNLIYYCQRTKTIVNSLNLSRFSNYCVMQLSPDRRKIALGSKDGHLEIYEEILWEADCWRLLKLLEMKITELKIFSLHWLSNEKLLICCDSGLLRIVDIDRKIVEPKWSFILPASRERWTTAAIIFGNLLICGDRAGSVYAYNFDSLDQRNSESLPMQVFPKIHGRLGVQSFAISANKLVSTGRDGTVRFYEFHDHTKRLETLHLKKMPMDWVCKILEENNDLYVLGFKEVEFMVYSMNLKRIVQRYVCGGGHRSWDCKISNGKMNFLYIRDKRVYELDSELRNTDLPIKKGFHTKEIYSIEFLETLGTERIFLSASEDCTLRLSCIVAEKSTIQKYSVESLETYEGHISNVKSLAILNMAKSQTSTKNLVVSGGGRGQLKIWEICVTMSEGKKLNNDSTTCRELLTYMLRGTDKDRKRNWRTNEPAFFVDPETRFMDLKIQFYENSRNLVIIFVACSDGFSRTFLYDIEHNNLRLSPSVNYCNRCALKINNFVHESQTILMSMTTDGIVRFWQMNRTIKNLVENSIEKLDEADEPNVPFADIKIHQSGINSFDFRPIDNSRWLLLTGGDDNLLSLVVVEILLENKQNFARLLATWNSSSIHSAQITGAKFVDSHRILSTGIDQRVCVHSYSYENGLLSVSPNEGSVTLVPDVQGVALCRTKNGNDETLACVFGKGLEVIVLGGFCTEK